MRLSTAAIFIAAFPVLSSAFVSPTTTSTDQIPSSSPCISPCTGLGARRSILPILRSSRPSSRLFPDFESLFDEMDEMMERSFDATASFSPRPSISLLGGGNRDIFGHIIPHDDDLTNSKRPLGFEVTQNDHEYKMVVRVPNVDAKDLDLQLDHDGRVLRLKGERNHEDGRMTVQSKFEKSILLGPDVDTTQLAASMSGDTLTVVAPKKEPKKAFEWAEHNRIKINIEQQPPLEERTESASVDGGANAAKTRLAIETLKDDRSQVDNKKEANAGEKKWPVKDFPY